MKISTLNLGRLWMVCFSWRTVTDLQLYRWVTLRKGARGFQHATKVASHVVSEGQAKSKMVLRRPRGGSQVPSVGRANIKEQIVVDLTLSSNVKAIIVTAGTHRAYWFNVGGIVPCDLCVRGFFLIEWSMSVMCSAKTLSVCRASGNALNFMFFLCVGGCH